MSTWKEPTVVAALITAGVALIAALIPLVCRAISKWRQRGDTDIEILRFFSTCFDRPAFQDQFSRPQGVEAFDKAIEDTITALNTGALYDRAGKELAKEKGKSYLSNRGWRKVMDDIVATLREIRAEYASALARGDIVIRSIGGQGHHEIANDEFGSEIDDKLRDVIKRFNDLCSEAGIGQLPSP